MATKTANSRLIYLEPLELRKHLADFHTIWSNPRNLIWSSQQPKQNLEESRKWMDPMISPPNGPLSGCYAIMLPSEPRPRLVGTCGVMRASPTELGYMVDHKYWGQGVAGEAVSQFLAMYWERRPDVQCLDAKVDAENVPSVRILRKHGFVERDVLRATFNLQGRGLRDMVLYRLDRPK